MIWLNWSPRAASALCRSAGPASTVPSGMVARESMGKIERRVGLEIVQLDAPPQRLSGGRPDGLVGLDVDFDLRAMQRRFLLVVHSL